MKNGKKMPPYLAEIPYGFKNLWQISVIKFDLSTSSFRTEDIKSVILNGSPVSVEQLEVLYDFNRDGCSLSQQSSSGIYVTLKGFNAETSSYSFQILIEQNLTVTGVANVTGDMVDNSDPLNPIILHDDKKLDIFTYENDKQTFEDRLTADENAISINATNILELQEIAITGINLNNTPVSIKNNIADVKIDTKTSAEIELALSKKVDKNVAGVGGTVVSTYNDSFTESTGTLSFEKTLLSLETGTKNTSTNTYPLADLLGITDLESLDKELFYFCDDKNITNYNDVSSISLSTLYRFNADGTKFIPTTTENIFIIFGIAQEYSGFGIQSRQIITSIGKVSSYNDNTLTCVFTNIQKYAVYSEFNGYRAGNIIYSETSKGLYYTLQNVPAPTSQM